MTKSVERGGRRRGVRSLSSVGRREWIRSAVGAAMLLGGWTSAERSVVGEEGEAMASDLRADETLVFFPTAGRFDDERGEWELPIHGWVFEPEADSRTRRALVEMLQSAWGLSAQDAASETFQRRLRPFLVDNERGKRIVVRGGERTIPCEKSGADGHFFGVVRLPEAEASAGGERRGWEFEAVLREGDSRRFRGVVRLVGPTGRTVVSDIDDTVKITEVRDKKRLLDNTLLRPFRPVDGMAAVYRRWADSGVDFQWVSSSPWQLYEPLAELFASERFPDAAWRLKAFRLTDAGIVSLLADPEASKVSAIGELIARYPRRKFTLIGDSGERDPEAYGRLALRHPEQVDQIWIRDVTDQPADDPRYQACWGELRPGVARLFHDPQTLRLPDEAP